MIIRDGLREGAKERMTEGMIMINSIMIQMNEEKCVCVCVYVCVWSVRVWCARACVFVASVFVCVCVCVRVWARVSGRDCLCASIWLCLCVCTCARFNPLSTSAHPRPSFSFRPSSLYKRLNGDTSPGTSPSTLKHSPLERGTIVLATAHTSTHTHTLLSVRTDQRTSRLAAVPVDLSP